MFGGTLSHSWRNFGELKEGSELTEFLRLWLKVGTRTGLGAAWGHDYIAKVRSMLCFSINFLVDLVVFLSIEVKDWGAKLG